MKKKSSLRRKLQSKKLKERVKQSKRNSEGKRNSIVKDQNIPVWRPKEGDHIVDIIPYIAGPNDKDISEGEPTYTFEYLVHRNVGPNNLMFLCLQEMYNKPCPICEHRMQLIEAGSDDTVWKPLFARKRNLYNIICYDRGEEEKGIQVWDEAYFYSEKNIMAISKKRGRGGKIGKLQNFSDVDKGKSVSFQIEPAVSKNDFKTYTGFTFEERDYTIEDELLENTFCLDEIVLIPEYEDISEIYWGSKSPDEEEEEEEEPSSRSKRGRLHSKKDDDQEGNEEDSPDTDALMEALQECEDLDDLQDFVDDNEIGFKIKSSAKFKKTKRLLEALVLEDNEEEEEEEDDIPF